MADRTLHARTVRVCQTCVHTRHTREGKSGLVTANPSRGIEIDGIEPRRRTRIAARLTDHRRDREVARNIPVERDRDHRTGSGGASRPPSADTQRGARVPGTCTREREPAAPAPEVDSPVDVATVGEIGVQILDALVGLQIVDGHGEGLSLDVNR